MTTAETLARTVMERCAILGGYSEETGRLTRPFASDAMRKVNEVVLGWMQAAGMTTQQDAVGNLIGRYEASAPQARTMLLGSHLDTVRDAGTFDGPLGVMVAIACIESLQQRQVRLPFAIEVLGFADEEGLRYHSTYLGSRGMSGTFDLNDLQLLDSNGISMADALRAFGGDPEVLKLHRARWQPEELIGYCEVHIEQGPVLEARNLPVGIVTAIASQSRITLQFTGEAGHAGTVPMSLRHDALCAAAEFVLAAEAYARNNVGVVTTVGQLSVQPSAINVIPGHITLSLDVRHQDDQTLLQACQHLEAQAHTIGQARGVVVEWHLLKEYHAIPCSPRMMGMLEQAIRAEGYAVLALASGAGHDAAVISELTDIGMLFVRCRGGISHHPAESVTQADVTVAIRVMERFLQQLAKEEKER